MSTMKVFRAFLVVALCVVAGTGCRSGRGGEMDPAELVDPLTIEPGDTTMAPRFGEDGRILNAGFENVHFDYDSFQIHDSEMYKIEQVSVHMRNDPQLRLVVEGHCDERGGREYNLSLGEHRAQAIRTHLIQLGIGSERIQTRSFGEEKPLDPGHNDSAWRQNRRGEFALYR